MGGSKLQEFFLKRSSPQRIGDVGQRDCIGVDASWMIQRFLQRYRIEIEKDNVIRAVHEFIRRVENLEKEKVIVYVVFDGECPPCKLDESRRRVKQGKLRRTRALEKGIIAALKARRTAYVVAPYEAEAQLVYMQRTQEIDLIIAQDADYIALGCRKMVWNAALKDTMCWGYLIDLDDDVPSGERQVGAHEAAFLSLFEQKGNVVLRMFAALVGCDYVRFKGIGPDKAMKAIVAAYNGDDLSAINVAHKAFDHCTGTETFDEFVTKLEYALLSFTKPVVYDVKRGIRVTLDGSVLDSGEEAVVGTCDKDFDVVSFARGDIDPRTGRDDVVTPHLPNDENFFSAVDGRVEPRDLPGSNCPTVKEFMSVTNTAAGRRKFMMQNGLLHGDPSRPGVVIDKNAVPDSKRIATWAEQFSRLEMQGGRRTLRDVNGRSQAEIIAQSRGRGPETSSSTEDELKPPAWFEAQAHHYNTLKNNLPLMSMEVVDTYFRRFEEYHLSSVCAPMVKGTELVRTSSDKNTMRYDYVVKNVDTGEARCWWKTTWRSNHDTSVRSTTVITMCRQRDAPTPHGSFRVVSIDRAVCDCVSGVTGWCKHIAAALILFHNLNQKNTDADDATCTSKPCTWLAPPKNAMKKSKEVRNIEFRQPKGNRPHSPAARSCRNADADRVEYQVYGDDVLAEMDEYRTGDLREAFFCEFKKSHRGEPCAADRYMHTLAAVRAKKRPQNSTHFILHESKLS